MLLARQKSLEDHIVEQLQDGPTRTAELLRKISQKRPHTTKQGMYRALRVLKKEEIIVGVHGSVSLNKSWFRALNRFLKNAQKSHESQALQNWDFSDLRDGEKVQYTFTDPITADAFWNHVLLTIMEVTPDKQPFLAYNPHCWFYIAHPENERALRDAVIEQGRQYLILAAHRDPLDIAVRMEFDRRMSQYHIVEKPIFPYSNYYLNVVSDFIVEVWLDARTSTQIDRFYATEKELTETTQSRLHKLLKTRGKTRLTISRHGRKASTLRHRLSRPFIIEKD